MPDDIKPIDPQFRAAMIACGAKDLGDGSWDWECDDFVERLYRHAYAAGHADREGRQRWQPIETAPKDGTRALLASPGGRIADGMFLPRYGVWSWPYVMANPVMWMPMPSAPPADAQRAKGDV